MSAVIALAAAIFHHLDPTLATNVGVARAAMWVAAIAGAILPATSALSYDGLWSVVVGTEKGFESEKSAQRSGTPTFN